MNQKVKDDTKVFSMGLTVPFMEWQSRRIKAARAMRNKSAQQVADALEVSLTQYKRGESNARRWKPGELLVIARFLAVPDAWLLHEEFDPFAVIPEPAPAASEPDAHTAHDTPGSSGTSRRLRTSVRSGLKERQPQADGDQKRNQG